MAFLRVLATCGCGAPARVTLLSARNDDLGVFCWHCGRRALKARQRIERGERAREHTPAPRVAGSV